MRVKYTLKGLIDINYLISAFLGPWFIFNQIRRRANRILAIGTGSVSLQLLH
jgi:hypothetical protein